MSKKVSNPVLFSKYFNVTTQDLFSYGVIDPVLNIDTKIFIDPVLLKFSSNAIIKSDAMIELNQTFVNIINLLSASKAIGDPAWKGALKQLNLDERSETCFGFGAASIRGKRAPRDVRSRILQTTKQVIDLGIDNPQIISLMGFLDEGVGPDTISDMTTNAIFASLAKITGIFCLKHNIKTRLFTVNGHEYKLPAHKLISEPQAVILVPQDIVRDLPVAADWADVQRAAFENSAIRDRVSALIADIARATITEKKKALKDAALRSAADFLSIFDQLINPLEKSYDVKSDKNGIYMFRYALQDLAKEFPLNIPQAKSRTNDELKRIVNSIIAHFKFIIENNGVNDLLWDKDVPRSEKSAQMLFFAVGDAYCKANNIDISPETNSGGGPVDFKFSSGYNGRIVVELKLSTGAVVHGYKTQIEVYKDANSTEIGIFIIINVGKIGNKLKDIQEHKRLLELQNKRTSEIVNISAIKQRSASKR